MWCHYARKYPTSVQYPHVVYAGNVIRELWLKDNIWPDSSGGFFFGLVHLGSLCIISLVLSLLFNLCVDVNKISPHYFYRDRLGETFLKTVKSNDPKTVVRNNMEMKLSDLHGSVKDEHDQETGICAARGPYLLINATLNLTASQDLKAFNRKSDIFTFSRLFVGPVKKRFIKTNEYKVDDGELKLARVIAISSAAVSSLKGINSTLARSFACTVLGVRLGYWLSNFYKNCQNTPNQNTPNQNYRAKYRCKFCRLFK